MAEDTKKQKGKTKAGTERAKATAKRNPTTGADESKIKKAGKKAVAKRQPARMTDAEYAPHAEAEAVNEAKAKPTAPPKPTLKSGLMGAGKRLASIAARKANLIAGAVVAGMTAAGLLKGDTADGGDFDAQLVGSSMEGGIPMRPRRVEESFGARDSTADMPVEDRKQHMLEKIGGERRAVFARQHSLPKYDPGVNTAQPPTAGLAPQAEKPLSEASFAPRAVQTKGGSYPVFDKASQEAADFRKTFAQSRAAGQSQFEWQGRLYNTKVK